MIMQQEKFHPGQTSMFVSHQIQLCNVAVQSKRFIAHGDGDGAIVQETLIKLHSTPLE